MLTTDMADLALELDEMHSLIAEDVVVNHETNLSREFLEERAVRLGSHWTSIRVDWFDIGVGGGKKINRGSTDLAFVDQIAYCLLPSPPSGIVMPY